VDFSEAKEAVKEAADIVEVIGQYVQLKKRGQNYTGLCPFHSERTPSFTVHQGKQIYHCFGCGRGGDVFAFWMEYNNVSFPQSLKDLAERYNIPLPSGKNRSAEKKQNELKGELYAINDLAGHYFHNMLGRQTEGRPGREYLSRRGISQETISTFKLGYAAKRWDGLVKFFRSKNIALGKGEKAGLLVAKKDGTYYDRFRGRLIFPIFDLNRHTIGFGGRVLDDSLPKYINTPETLIYHKGRTLYGLDSASRHIRESATAIIVEGYMDMLALRQKGMPNVVATLGTALTSDQARRLKGYTKDVVILFDPDPAGREAALKSFPLFLNEGISAKVLVLPQGEDPDSFVNRHGIDEFKARLEGAIPIFDFYLDQALAHTGSGVEGQVKILREAMPIFFALEEGATRSLYVRKFSEKTGISEAIVSEEMRHWMKIRSERREVSQPNNRVPSSRDSMKHSSDQQFLNLLLHYPEKIHAFRDQDWELIVSDPEIGKIINVIMERSVAEENLGRVEEFLDSAVAKEKLRVMLMSQPFYSTKESVDQAVEEFTYKIAMIKLSQSMRRAFSEGDMELFNRLMKAKQDLDLQSRNN
jgi:DNA primase